jgi:replicative DNA helicase
VSPIPSNPEQLLISSVLRNRNEGFNDASKAGIKTDMFSGYADEWKWIVAYVNKNHHAPSKGAFMYQFPDFRVKLVDDTSHFASEVRASHARRELTKTIRECGVLLEDGRITDACSILQEAAIHVGAKMGGLNDSNFTEDWEDIFKEVTARKVRYDKFGMAGVPTGFTTFDERTGGLAPGQLTVVASRMGQYKSWTLMRMATAAIMDGFTAHYSSLEMSKTEVGVRMHNMLSGGIGKTVFKARDLIQGKDLDLDAYRMFLRQLRTTVKGSLTVSDTRNIGLAEIQAQIERYHPDVYFLDYLTLARIGGDGGWKAVGDFTKGLKDMAQEAQCSIVVAAQLNRGAVTPGAKAGPENLGQSDQIGQDADTLIFSKKKSGSRQGGVILYDVPKLRQGADGFGWWAMIDTERGVFEEITAEQAKKQMELDKSRQDLMDSIPEVVPVRRLRLAVDATKDQTGAAALTRHG